MQIALVLFFLAIVPSCSNKTMSLLFDVPPPKPEAEPTTDPTEALRQAPATTDSLLQAFATDPNTEKLPIEDVLDWRQAQEMLPKDYKGKVDWSAALEQGLVRPQVEVCCLVQI